ncbi:anthranilate synthase component I [Thiohalobacter sp. IOR34]|uniref:anthranilate synthase component I n=1 Tax=Thiohalobacter sp. IOR34 TaxID=3057176 RepID=UPI0025B0771F|nr:anthranilate synthase component I [Thiohalobacter sp. IOR34]WJW75844.1 anthranilate synthase component I [Thiohalobacter sp. IOR34]
MDSPQFQQLTEQGYNRIPLMREVLADLDTPLSTYLKLADGPYSYLFESVQGGEKWGRYSIIGLPARSVLRVRGRRIERLLDGAVVEQLEVEDPLAWIETFQQGFRVPEVEGLPRFTGGLVGYFGYDTVRYIEPRLAVCAKPDPLDNPDILLMVSDEVVVFDNLSGKLYVIVHADPAEADARARAEARLDELVARLRRETPRPAPLPRSAVAEEDFVSGFTREGFEAAVRRCKDYIVEGDVMQVVISQRLSIPFHARPLDLYRALRSLNPSPYMFYLNLDDFHVVGSSPEILARLEDGVVTVRPIAGTRPRGRDEAEDRALEADLLADPKELAEHLMLIDLGRNDVGRIAEIGSVELTEKMVIERYSHVMHIVSNVQGRLKPGLSAMDVLRATFPAGTVSGAPKIRAMEIIDELEPVKRGVYAGAVGYLAWNGNMDTAIAIRTAVVKHGQLHIQAGAGIVHDSVPAKEWEETMNKGRALFRAVALAEAGLEGGV